MQVPFDQIAALCIHPFTTIGLSDREKFHTGMLAHTLNTLVSRDRNCACELMGKLWADNNIAMLLKEFEGIKIDVEQKSIDLIVTVDDKSMLFAEMKFKTTLSDGQLARYRRNHPDAQGAVLGLFPEAHEFGDEIPSIAFPSAVNAFFDQERHSRLLSSADDETVLIRMWVKYLELLSELTDWFANQGTDAIPEIGKFHTGLKKLKLRGIFEQFRFNLIAKKLEKVNCPIQSTQFNSHGRAGIDYLFDDQFPFGLQWQAGSLKLFIIDENYMKGNPTPDRDARLEHLATNFCKRFSQQEPPRMSQTGKFRSVTVERWDVFDDIGERTEVLLDRINFLADMG